MIFLGKTLLWLLDFYTWVIIASVAVSWLIAFGVLNIRNEQAANLTNLLTRATEPVYKPLRKFIPPIGGIDITPIVVLFAISLLKQFIIQVFFS